jgi:hypothetical protein
MSKLKPFENAKYLLGDRKTAFVPSGIYFDNGLKMFNG